MSNPSDFIIENGVLKKYTGPGGDVVIPDGVTAIHGEVDIYGPRSTAFYRCVDIKSVLIPEGVKELGLGIIAGCEALTTLKLPSSIGAIGWDTLFGQDKEEYFSDDPKSVLGGGSFTEVLISPANKKLCDADGVVFSKNGKKLILYPMGRKEESYTIPGGVTQIGAAAFKAAFHLKSLQIPEGVNSIAAQAIKMTGMEYLHLPHSVEKLANKAVDVPYVSFYHPEIADKVKAPIYLGGPIDDLGPKVKNAAVKGFVYAVQHGIEEIEQFADSYVEHIKNNAKTYCKAAAKDEFLFHWMIEKELIPQKECKALLSALEEAQRSDLTAELLTYQHEHFGGAKDELSLEDNDAEMKRALQMAKRREQIKDQKGIKGIVFVESGPMDRFGRFNYYTNARDMRDLKAFIEQRGGKFRDAISSKTDYLICNEPDSDTVKVKEAKKLGVAIITEVEFLKMAEETE